jgi:tetratricopeptide (TPR) repeat protein
MRQTQDSIDATEQPTADTGKKHARWLALIAAVFFLSAPVVYLAMAAAKAPPVSASGQQAMAPASGAGAADLSSLQSAAASSPTPANRLNLALAYIQANTPERAVPVLLALVAEDKGNVTAWNDLCVAHILQKDYGTAIANCEEALRVQPGYQLAANNLKWAQDEQRKAVAALGAQKKTAPDARDSAFYVNEGLDYLHLGDYDDAIQSWQRALAQDPHSAIAANDIGTAYMLKKQTATAIPWFQKAITMDPSMQLAKNNLAWAHSEAGKPAQ